MHAIFLVATFATIRFVRSSFTCGQGKTYKIALRYREGDRVSCLKFPQVEVRVDDILAR